MDHRNKSGGGSGGSRWRTAINPLSIVTHGLFPWVHPDGKRILSSSTAIGVQFSDSTLLAGEFLRDAFGFGIPNVVEMRDGEAQEAQAVADGAVAGGGM